MCLHPNFQQMQMVQSGTTSSVKAQGALDVSPPRTSLQIPYPPRPPHLQPQHQSLGNGRVSTFLVRYLPRLDMVVLVYWGKVLWPVHADEVMLSVARFATFALCLNDNGTIPPCAPLPLLCCLHSDFCLKPLGYGEGPGGAKRARYERWNDADEEQGGTVTFSLISTSYFTVKVLFTRERFE